MVSITFLKFVVKKMGRVMVFDKYKGCRWEEFLTKEEKLIEVRSKLKKKVIKLTVEPKKELIKARLEQKEKLLKKRKRVGIVTDGTGKELDLKKFKIKR